MAHSSCPEPGPLWRGGQYLAGVPGGWREPGHSRLIFRYRDMDTTEETRDYFHIALDIAEIGLGSR